MKVLSHDMTQEYIGVCIGRGDGPAVLSHTHDMTQEGCQRTCTRRNLLLQPLLAKPSDRLWRCTVQSRHGYPVS
jgi:hypothetical protein